MGRTVTVLLGHPNAKKRRSIQAELLAINDTTIRVKLPDGNVITRRKDRDVPKEVLSESIQ